MRSKPGKALSALQFRERAVGNETGIRKRQFEMLARRSKSERSCFVRMLAPKVGVCWKNEGNEVFSLMFPNPLWWIAGYGFVYPKRWFVRKWKKAFPRPNEELYCVNCGERIDGSCIAWCSLECLQAASEEEQPLKPV